MATLCLALALQLVAFEAASVRPSPPPPDRPFGLPVAPSIRIGPDGSVTASHTTLRDLVQRAYDLPRFLVDGSPPWASTERFEVIARAPAGPPAGAAGARAMLQTLLADRFALRVRIERREAAVFRLVTARRDGALGPRLRRSAIDCATLRARRGSDTNPPEGEPSCRPAFDMRGTQMTIAVQGETMDSLASLLVSPQMGRVIINDTGLAGTFDGDIRVFDMSQPQPYLLRRQKKARRGLWQGYQGRDLD